MKKRLKHWATQTQTYVLLIIVLYLVFLAFRAPHFYTATNILDTIRSCSWMMVFGMGAMMVLLSGGFDVSFTSIAVTSAYITCMLMVKYEIDSLLVAILGCVLIGSLFGALNGFLIYKFKLPSFITTMGTRTVFIGIMALVVGVSSLEPDQCPPSIGRFGMARLFSTTAADGRVTGLSVMVIPMIIAIFLVWFFVNKTRIGRGVVAMGNSQEAAKRAGYNLLHIHLFAYIFIGALSGMGGLMAVAETSYIAPLSSQIVNQQLNILAAVIIGGTSISGGKGTVFGSILGVLLIRIFDVTLAFVGLSSSWNDFFIGAILIICLSVTSLQQYRTRRKKLLFND